MLKVAIAGAGAMGGRIGSYLKQAGENVVFIDEWVPHVEKMREQGGVRISTETKEYFVPIDVFYPEEIESHYDFVILLTKAMDSEKMLKTLIQQGAIDENTAVLTMMNGLGHGERLSHIVNRSQLYVAVTVWTAGLLKPGHLLLEGSGNIKMQRHDQKTSEMTAQINQMFNQAELNSTVVENVDQIVWEKAALNSVMNPLCTILNQRLGKVGTYSAAYELIHPILEEIVTVASKKRVDMDIDDTYKTIAATFPDAAAGLHYPSMHQDFNAGRLTEIDYLNGQVAAYGREFNIATPLNDMLTHMVHLLEEKSE